VEKTLPYLACHSDRSATSQREEAPVEKTLPYLACHSHRSATSQREEAPVEEPVPYLACHSDRSATSQGEEAQAEEPLPHHNLPNQLDIHSSRFPFHPPSRKRHAKDGPCA